MKSEVVKGLVVRPAQADDVGLILSFIKKLADYEKLSTEVTATEAKLAETLFGKNRHAEVVIAELDRKNVGFALFFHNYSTFLAKPGIYLEDLFVVPETRGRGVGKALLIYLAKLAESRGCGRLEWSVLNWNRPAIEFYERQGAVPMSGWTVYREAGEALDNLAGQPF